MVINHFLSNFLRRKFLFLWILLLIISGSAIGKNRDNNSSFFIGVEFSNETPCVGEAVIISFYLYSKDGEVAYINRSNSFSLESQNHEFLASLDFNSRAQRVRIGNEEYYRFPIEKYVITFPDKGKYSIQGDSFEVGVNTVVVYDDPFWGPRRGYNREKISLEVEPAKLNVKSSFKGRKETGEISPVGMYTIATTIPPGDILLEHPARALIILKGKGILNENILPEYREAFNNATVKLKSMSEKRNLYYDGKDVISEIIMDCEFIPLERDAELGSVSFDFYNPESGKMERIVSKPVRVEVKSIISKIEPIEV